MATFDVSTLEGWLWDAACKIRGQLDAPKFKDYILPLIFLKRPSDVFEDEIARLGQEFGSADVALQLVDEDHALVRFYVPEAARWPTVARMTTGLGEHLTALKLDTSTTLTLPHSEQRSRSFTLFE
jgi:type I restriction enzyme M protein